MKTGLVLEGGALRGIFTSGVLDCFLMEGVSFDYMIGVSAGAGNITGYRAGQVGRTANVIAVPKEDSYFGAMELVRSKKFFNLQKMFDINGKHPLDLNAYFENKVETEFVVCCCESGRAEYLSEERDAERLLKIVEASCSLPMFCSTVEIDGKHYLDGGIGNSIPCDRAIAMGCERLVVVLTKPIGTDAEDYGKYMRIIRRMYPQYPNFWRACEKRMDNYKRSMEYLGRLEEQGVAVVIRPKRSISKFEKDIPALRSYYKHGYDAACAKLGRIKRHISE